MKNKKKTSAFLILIVFMFVSIVLKAFPFSTVVFDFDQPNISSEVEQSPSRDIQDFTGLNYEVLPRAEKIHVTLDSHIDGDTSRFLINGCSVKTRYLLIDTPETVHPNKKAQPFGTEASDRTKQLLQSAKKIELMLDQGDILDRTSAKRLLAYVFVDDQLLQDVLIKEGLARVAYIQEPNTMFLNQLLTSQQQAQKDSLAIWSLNDYVTSKGFNH